MYMHWAQQPQGSRTNPHRFWCATSSLVNDGPLTHRARTTPLAPPSFEPCILVFLSDTADWMGFKHFISLNKNQHPIDPKDRLENIALRSPTRFIYILYLYSNYRVQIIPTDDAFAVSNDHQRLKNHRPYIYKYGFLWRTNETTFPFDKTQLGVAMVTLGHRLLQSCVCEKSRYSDIPIICRWFNDTRPGRRNFFGQTRWRKTGRSRVLFRDMVHVCTVYENQVIITERAPTER